MLSAEARPAEAEAHISWLRGETAEMLNRVTTWVTMP